MSVNSFRCYIRGCEAEEPLYNESFMEFTIPKDDDGAYKQCEMHSLVNGSVLNTAKSSLLAQMRSLESEDHCQEDKFNETCEVNCLDGYVYDRSTFETSATMEVSSIAFTVIYG